MAIDSPDREDVAATAGEDEDTGAQITPIVTLREVAVTTGEEEEDVLLDLRKPVEGAGYRKPKTFEAPGDWNSGKVRLVMRQKKCSHCFVGKKKSPVSVVPSFKLQEHAGSDESCVWHASDFSDGELKEELFCIRFGSVENCKKFMQMVEGITELSGKDGKNSKHVSDAAGQLGKLSVDVAEAETASVAVAKSEEKTGNRDLICLDQKI
ncbi:hypothetical protein ZIOFF_023467 [Zingiber officinale]|uniref:RanBD1 domain-containing protein n=1 Tax=Zingiber officinale TaxID=94328 RepID=A0A8J5H6J7_ZINOF|nr:hypothetical protein ZIOFF_023467 [Zingiber officinale]